MKSIATIQNDIRALQLELEKMQRSFDKIQNELEEIKNQDKGSTEIEDVYKIAEQNAQWVQFLKHPMMNEVNKQKKIDYVLFLLYCLNLDKGEIINGLTFISWIKEKLEVKKTIKELYMQIVRVKADFFRKLDGFSTEQRESLMLDCMIIIALNGGIKDSSSQFLADLTMILKLDETKIVELSLLSKAVVGHGYEKLSWSEVSKISNISKRYAYYLSSSFLKYFKREIDTLPINSIKDNSFKQVASNTKKVKKGQIVAKYISKRSRKDTISNIEAKRDGVNYVIMLNDKYYFIITQEGDTKQKIMEWLKQEESK